MFRKSGNRFSEQNMRKIEESRAHHDSTQSGCALMGARTSSPLWQNHHTKTDCHRRHAVAAIRPWFPLSMTGSDVVRGVPTCSVSAVTDPRASATTRATSFPAGPQSAPPEVSGDRFGCLPSLFWRRALRPARSPRSSASNPRRFPPGMRPSRTRPRPTSAQPRLRTPRLRAPRPKTPRPKTPRSNTPTPKAHRMGLPAFTDMNCKLRAGKSSMRAS